MTQPKWRKKTKTRTRNANETWKFIEKVVQGYTQMFTGVRDPSHQCAQSYNYALCGPNHNSYSTGPGKVINDGECGYRESQMAATW